MDDIIKGRLDAIQDQLNTIQSLINQLLPVKPEIDNKKLDLRTYNKKLAQELIMAGKSDKVVSIFAKFGVKRLSEVKDECMQSLKEELECQE